MATVVGIVWPEVAGGVVLAVVLVGVLAFVVGPGLFGRRRRRPARREFEWRESDDQ